MREIEKNNIEEVGALGKAVTGGKWMTFDYVTQRILNTASFIILARLLMPADFGVLTLILLVPNFLNNITEPSFGVAVMQRSGPIEKYLNPIWTISFLRAAVISLLVFFGAPFIAGFLHIENAVTAVRLGGLFIIIYNLENIGFIYLFKNLDLKRVFIRNTLKEVTYVAVALPWALIAPSYWALVGASLASYTTGTVSTYLIHPFRPKFSKNFKILSDLVNYTKWVYSKNVLRQIYGNIENTVIGRSIGASAVGLYSRAKSLASLVPGFLSSTMRLVAFPAFAKIKDSLEKVKEGFFRSMHLLFFLYIPIIILLWAWAEKLILVVLGEQWLPMTGALKILVVVSSIDSVANIAFSLFQGIGRPDIETKTSIMEIPLLVLSILLLAPRYGITGVALALLISSLPSLTFSFYKLTKIVKIEFLSILKTAAVPLAASCLAILPTFFIKTFLSQLASLTFFIFMIIIGIIYLAIILIAGVVFKCGPYDTLKVIYANTKLL